MNIKTISLTGFTLALAASAFADPPADQVIKIGDKTGYSILLANPKVDDVVVVERQGRTGPNGATFSERNVLLKLSATMGCLDAAGPAVVNFTKLNKKSGKLVVNAQMTIIANEASARVRCVRAPIQALEIDITETGATSKDQIEFVTPRSLIVPETI